MNKNRQQDNFRILDILFEYLKKNPEIRFGQALSNLNLATHRKQSDEYTQGYNRTGYDDIFYEDSSNTLIKLRQL